MKKTAWILILVMLLCFCSCGGNGQSSSSEAPDPSASSVQPSVQETPAEETPAEETPAEETPAEETPAEETPAEETPEEEPLDEKPVIYLYPEETAEITVRLNYAGTITCTYPVYEDGWHVLADPDGILTDDSGRQYSCLFWEGISDASYDFRRGFCVAGEDTLAFLEEKLAVLGLSDREAGDFIAYWLPRMQDNPYNLIAFQGRAYTDAAGLAVEPEPDTVIRVFMAFRPLEEEMDIPEQELPSPERTGFTLVEWGGTEIED